VYKLRSTTDEDAALLYRVYASTREEELALVSWTDEERDAFLRMQFAAQDTHYRRHYEGAQFSVILVGEEPAGRLYVYRTPREIRVMDVALLPAFRRRGIGERIFRDLFAEADACNQLVSIHVETYNPARRLYERLGFQPVDSGEIAQAYVLMERYANTA
jgi:ribosomal protein S18 acetylase RimI-like enzyme